MSLIFPACNEKIWDSSEKVDFDRSIETLKTVEINQNKLDSEEVLLTERKKNTLSQVSLQEEKIEIRRNGLQDQEFATQLKILIGL